jgi:hypothetical protein
MRPERLLTGKADVSISAEEAATLIFGTASPTLAQIGSVRELMRRGELRQSARRQFTTTREAVAEYLTNRELRKAQRSVQRGEADATEDSAAASQPAGAATPQRAASRLARPARPARSSREEDRHLSSMYRELLQDYFLSMVIYGRARDRSAQYQRNVLVGRCVVLVALVAFVAWQFTTMFGTDDKLPGWAAGGAVRVQQDHSPEKQVILEFLQKYRKSAVLMDILPAATRPGGKAVRVRYRHELTDRRTGKTSTVYDDRVFVVHRREIVHDEGPSDADRGLEAKITGQPAEQDPRKRPPVDGLLPPPPPPKR